MDSGHSLLTGDLNADGRPDVIAGQRYLGHDGKDVGEYNPLVSYFYSWNGEHRTWHRQPISTNAGVGFGLDPKIDDIDLDGDLDLVCADRNGLFLLENQLCSAEPQEQSSDVPIPEVRYPDHSQIMILRDQAGGETPITTPGTDGEAPNPHSAGHDGSHGRISRT